MRTLRLFPGGAFTAALVITVFASPLYAEVLPNGQTIDQRLADLEQEVRTLKRQREVEQEVQAKKEKETPLVLAGKQGFGLKSKDGDFEYKLKGYIQADSRAFADADRVNLTDQFLLRRIRPIFEGTVYKYVGFRFMPDFGGGTTTIQDAYIDFKYWKAASLRFGKFKEPFGLERLQSGAALTFIERGLPTNLVPNRDVGVMLFGELFTGRLEYQVGAFNGVADGSLSDGDNADDKDITARIFTKPFKETDKDWINGLGFGVAGSYGNAHGTSSSSQLGSYKSQGQNTFYSYASGVFADGSRIRLSPQTYYSWGPFGLLGEYVFSSQTTRLGGVASDLLTKSWQIAPSYVLTGEAATYTGVAPRHSFDPANGTWGAFEIATRFGQLIAEDDAFNKGMVNPLTSANKATSWGLGLNWYLNKSLKFQVNFDQTYFDGGQQSLTKDREVENALLTRTQAAF